MTALESSYPAIWDTASILTSDTTAQVLFNTIDSDIKSRFPNDGPRGGLPFTTFTLSTFSRYPSFLLPLFPSSPSLPLFAVSLYLSPTLLLGLASSSSPTSFMVMTVAACDGADRRPRHGQRQPLRRKLQRHRSGLLVDMARVHQPCSEYRASGGLDDGA